MFNNDHNVVSFCFSISLLWGVDSLCSPSSGLPGLSTATTKQVYERHFKNKKTGKFEEFHIAYIEFCKWASFLFCGSILCPQFICFSVPISSRSPQSLCRYFNTVMPGQDFDTPSLEKIQVINP